MSASKTPGRVIDGPYAAWAQTDEVAQIVLAAAATLVLGQPLCLDLTNLGPDNNVPNNAAALSQCERLVATTSANAGPVFGVFIGFPNASLPKGIAAPTVSSATNGGAPTYTNNSGATITATVNIRKSGWGYVFAGTASSSPTAITVFSKMIISASYPYAIVGTPAPFASVGAAIATAINTTSPTTIAAGSRTVTPVSMVGITTTTPLLIDTLVGGQQETVTPSAVTATTFTATFANGHAASYPITGAANGPSSSLIAANASASGLVTALISSGA